MADNKIILKKVFNLLGLLYVFYKIICIVVVTQMLCLLIQGDSILYCIHIINNNMYKIFLLIIFISCS